MILMRETTPNAMLRLTVAAGASTPSMRYSTRVSPSSGLTWMSEAPWETACATIEWTSLMIGASRSLSSTSTSSCCSASSASSTMSSIATSRCATRASNTSRSSDDAATGRTRRPVSIATSSIVSTLVGSAIASSSVSSSPNPIATAL